MAYSDKDYNMKFILVFGRLGKKPEEYIQDLKNLGRRVYNQTHFFVNSESQDSFQIGFVPIMTKFEHTGTTELIMLEDLIRQKFPEYKSMVFHCKQGRDWGKNYE